MDLVRAINEPWVNYLYCAPRSFHLSGADPTADIAAMMRYAGDRLQHVHIADSFNHKGSFGLRSSAPCGSWHEGTGRGLIKAVRGASLVRVHPVRPSVAYGGVCRSAASVMFAM